MVSYPLDSVLIWDMGVKSMGRTGNSQYPHPSKRVRTMQVLSTTSASHEPLQITENYISQAALLSGFLVGSVNGGRLEGGRRKMPWYFLLHSSILLWQQLTNLGSTWRSWHLGSRNTSFCFCPFSLGRVMTSCSWKSLSSLVSPCLPP